MHGKVMLNSWSLGLGGSTRRPSVSMYLAPPLQLHSLHTNFAAARIVCSRSRVILAVAKQPQ